MKMLLTGGAGYIGSHTAVALLDAGHDVVVVDNYANSSPEAIKRVEKITGKSVNLYEADVADRPAMMQILGDEMPDCIIHFAGLKAVGESVEMPVEYYDKKTKEYDTTVSGKDYSNNCHHHNTFEVCACAGDANYSISEAKTKCRWFSIDGDYEINPSTGKKIGTQTKDVHSDTFKKADITELKSMTYEELSKLYPEAKGDGKHKLCQSTMMYNSYVYCKDCNKILSK